MTWMESAVVVVAFALVGAALAAQCWLPQPQRYRAHPNHPLATSVGREFVVNIDHPHVRNNSTPQCAEHFAPAVLPRSAAPGFAVDIVAATAEGAATPIHPVVATVRGPPAGLDIARSGQDLLTRFCLARR
ncbi:hypothetical protein [Mycobacterium spongiae]|uniref:Lipoprotein LpqS n=1 Tax=Mycobacterium spongiae TaxID=886343 RepID=A0A975K310_9MYCO|nr:hypothetical protein [Mycobacterium spongiae]QUR69948.1 hypothetical protein F6B93_19155 [Mycobacterium spongiae]